MKDLLPYRGLMPDVHAALTALETADRFDGLAQAYRTVRQEADRRTPIFLALCLPVAALGAGLIWIAQILDWLPRDAPWAYAFGPILFVALVMAFLRPQAMRDDTRIGNALKKWQSQATQDAGGKTG